MAGSYPTLQLGPATYEVNVAVTGGQLVEPDSTTGKVKPATAGSKFVLGMAMDDAVPTGSGDNVHFGTARNRVAVLSSGEAVRTATAVAIVAGSLVIAGANGTVATIASGTFDQAIGRCTEPGGITASGTGRIRLF
jgi:polygalacturonase